MDIQTILLIDDDPNIRVVTEMSLESVGNWKVIAAESGAEALSVVKETRPDLILLDIMMPGMDGPSTLENLRKILNPMPPVIFLTAKVQSSEIEQFEKLGTAGVITKPFDPLILPEQIMFLVNTQYKERLSHTLKS